MKIARFKLIDHPSLVIILEADSPEQQTREGYIRVSEIIEVTFRPLQDNVTDELEALEAHRSKVEKKYDAELARLDERKAQLQAGLPECTEGVAA